MNDVAIKNICLVQQEEDINHFDPYRKHTSSESSCHSSICTEGSGPAKCSYFVLGIQTLSSIPLGHMNSNGPLGRTRSDV